MTYSVKEMFYTLQGEGANCGRAAVFLRFSGCNLWSGRDEDRHQGPGSCSRWCDTEFVGTDGVGGGRFVDAFALARRVSETWAGGDGVKRLVVCTGGEPLLQLNDAAICALRALDFEVAVETNGTIHVPQGLDWVCVSPKSAAQLVVFSGNELKLVYPQDGLDPVQFERLNFGHFFLQPKDGADRDRNTASAIQYCLAHPRWRLSIQMHKYVGLP